MRRLLITVAKNGGEKVEELSGRITGQRTKNRRELVFYLFIISNFSYLNYLLMRINA
jgi:hypothetical protein